MSAQWHLNGDLLSSRKRNTENVQHKSDRVSLTATQPHTRTPAEASLPSCHRPAAPQSVASVSQTSRFADLLGGKARTWSCLQKLYKANSVLREALQHRDASWALIYASQNMERLRDFLLLSGLSGGPARGGGGGAADCDGPGPPGDERADGRAGHAGQLAQGCGPGGPRGLAAAPAAAWGVEVERFSNEVSPRVPAEVTAGAGDGPKPAEQTIDYDFEQEFGANLDRSLVCMYFYAFGHFLEPLGPALFVAALHYTAHRYPWTTTFLVTCVAAFLVNAIQAFVMLLPRFATRRRSYNMVLVLAFTASTLLEFHLHIQPRARASHPAACLLVRWALVATPMFQLLCHCTDPGYLPRRSEEEGEDRQAEGPPSPYSRWCESCRIYRPARAKHCKVCDRCVVRMDHHCEAVNTCVGAGNQLYFLICVTSVAVGEIAFLLATLPFLQERAHQLLPEDMSFLWYRSVWEVCKDRQMTAILFMIHAVYGWMNTLTALRALIGALGNVTVNEGMNIYRYKYQLNESNNFHNPFDRGCLPNVCEYISSTRDNQPDFDQILMDWNEQMQLGKHPPASPACSVNAISKHQTRLVKRLMQSPLGRMLVPPTRRPLTTTQDASQAMPDDLEEMHS